MKTRSVPILLGFVLVALAGIASGQSPASRPIADPCAINFSVGDPYRIGPEDVLTVSVWKNDSLSGVRLVRSDGMISLPLVDDVQAAGLTPMQLRDALVTKLAPFVPSPSVGVNVNEMHSFKVSVMGEVVKPGRYELKSRATVLEMLALAAGFTQYASRSKVSVLRMDGATRVQIPFDYAKAVNGVPGADFNVQPNDVVSVP
jgi:polysaccharide export outer membrane protein